MTRGRRLAAILGAYIGIFSLYVLLPDMRADAFRIAVLVSVIFAGVLFWKKKIVFPVRKMILSMVMVLSVISACVRGFAFVIHTETQAKHFRDGEAHCAEGYITEISYEEVFGSSYDVRLLSVDGKETDLGAVLILPYNGDFSVGDIVTFEAKLTDSDQQYDIYRKADGIFLTAEAETAQKTGETQGNKLAFFETLRLWIQSNFQSYMDSVQAGFATAIMTGNRGNLDGHVRLAFARIGVSHILAVSGLHLSVVVGGLDLFLRWIAVPRKLKNVFLIFCTCFFACICGLSASVIRAAIMLTLAYIADTIGERYDSPTALFVAIFLIVAVRPHAVYDVGMWMSFLATFGILATVPVTASIGFKELPRLPSAVLRFLISVIGITVAASFFTLPITYMAFGGISLISPLANLLVVPLTQIVLYILIALTLLGGIPALAAPLGTLAQHLIDGVCDLAEGLSDFKGIYVSLKYPFVPWVIFTLIVGVLAVLIVRKLHAAHLFTIFALCMVLYGACYFGYAQMQRDQGYVYLQTDGKSDAVGIVSGKETVLVDISTGGYSVLGEAVKRMDDFYACEIDVLILTHYHSYHINTLLRLTQQIKIHRLLLPQPHSENDFAYYEQICQKLSDFSDIEVYATDGSQTVCVGEAVLLLEKTEYIKRSVHPIIRFSVSFGAKGVSYIGESATETDLSDMGNSVVIFGSDGPTVRHIFGSEAIDDAELVVFPDRSYAALTDTEMIAGEIVFSEDYGGCVTVLFE